MGTAINAIDRESAHSLAYGVVFFILLLATALALGSALARVLQMPNLIGLAQDDYFISQKSYLGWHKLAYLLAIEFTSMAAMGVFPRRRRRPSASGDEFTHRRGLGARKNLGLGSSRMLADCRCAVR